MMKKPNIKHKHYNESSTIDTMAYRPVWNEDYII